MAKKKATEEKKPDNVEEITWKEIEFKCPVRGLVKQKVKVIRYKAIQQPETAIVRTGNPLIDKGFDLEEVAIFDDEEPKK